MMFFTFHFALNAYSPRKGYLGHLFARITKCIRFLDGTLVEVPKPWRDMLTNLFSMGGRKSVL
jgi:hypothetical protein